MRVFVYCPYSLSSISGSRIRMLNLLSCLDHNNTPYQFATLEHREIQARPNHTPIPVNEKKRVENTLARINSFSPNIVLSITESDAATAMAIASALDARLLFDIHGFGFIESLSHNTRWKVRIATAIHSLKNWNVIRNADGIIIANPTMMDPIQKFFKTKSYLLSGLVDFKNFPTSPPSTCHNNNLTVTYAGNCMPWQGWDLFLSVAKRSAKDEKPYHFNFICSSSTGIPDAISFYSTASRNTTLYKDIPYKDIHTLLLRSDILVIPRRLSGATYFAFPNKLIDFMACGRCVVATNLKPHRYAITSGVNGLLCEPNSDGIYHAIQDLEDPLLRMKLSTNARTHALKHYSIHVQAPELKDILRSVAV